MKSQMKNYVGIVSNGIVQASRPNSPFLAFYHKPTGNYNRWRYVSETKLVFWSTKPSPEEKIAVENWLNEKGIKVEGHKNVYKENYFSFKSSDFKHIVKDSIREAFYTKKNNEILNEADSISRMDRIKDIKNYLNGSLKPIASETDKEYTVMILQNNRMIYIKNNDPNHPVPAVYFMEWWEEDHEKFGVTKNIWDNLSKEVKASVEAKLQLAKWIRKEYFDLYARFYREAEYDKWWKEGGVKIAISGKANEYWRNHHPQKIMEEFSLNEALFGGLKLAVEYYGEILPAALIKRKGFKVKPYTLVFFSREGEKIIKRGSFNLTKEEATALVKDEILPLEIQMKHGENFKVIMLSSPHNRLPENLLTEGLFGIRMKVRYSGRLYNALISKNITPGKRPFVFTSFYSKENEFVPFEQKDLSAADIQFMLKNYKFSSDAARRFKEWGVPEIISINGKDVSAHGFTFEHILGEELLFLENSARELELYIENKQLA